MQTESKVITPAKLDDLCLERLLDTADTVPLDGRKALGAGGKRIPWLDKNEEGWYTFEAWRFLMESNRGLDSRATLRS